MGYFLRKAYRKNRTHDPERTEDPGPYDDPGPYEDAEFFDEPGKTQELDFHIMYLIWWNLQLKADLSIIAECR